jgi:DNA-binding NtrC family response regulator/serine/threonine protein kinase
MDRMGRYEKIEKLGTGGEGEVWRVRDGLTGSDAVALKYVTNEDAAVSRRHLANEFSILASLVHPAVARVYDFGREPAKGRGESRFFFTREFIDGSPLDTKAWIGDPAGALAVFVEVLRALKPLHRSGLVHGDLKPQNVIVGPDGRVRLIDFSLSGEMKDPENRPSGTLLYMAPEILTGRACDFRSDIYAAGLLLMELLLGRHPLERRAGDAASLVKAHVEGGISLSAEAVPAPGETGRRIAGIATRLTNCDPSARASSVEEVEASVMNLGFARIPQDPHDRRSPVAVTRTRRLEKERVIRTLTRLTARRAGSAALSVTGTPGSGRSSLLREIKWHLQLEGMPVVELHFEEDADPQDGLSALGSQILWHAGEGTAGSDGAPPPPNGPGPADEHVLKALQRWPRDRPLVVLLDDVDRAPRLFFETTASILARPPRSGVILVASTDPSVESLYDSLPVDEKHASPLSPVSPEEITAMLRCVAGRHDPGTVRWIHDVSGGNYAIASEAVEYVASAGPSFDAAGETARTSARWVSRQWKKKYDKLGDEEKKLVAAVALHDEPVMLRDAAEFSPSAAAAAAAGALPADFLRRNASGSLEMPARFLKAAVEDFLEEKEKRRIHARWTETLRGRLQAASHFILHAVKAGRGGEVLDTALDESRRKKGAGRIADAILILETLLAGLPEKARARRNELLLLLAECYIEAGRITEASETIGTIHAPDSSGEAMKAGLLRGAGLIASGSVESGVTLLEGIFRSDAAPDELRMEAAVFISDALLRKGDYDGALRAVDEGRGLQAREREKWVISLLCTAGSVHLYRHKKKQAMESLNRAYDMAERHKDTISMIKVLGYKAMAEQMWGNLQSAAAFHREAIAQCERHGHTGRLSQNYLNLATILHRQGDFSGSINYYLSAIDYAARSGQKAAGCNARINYGMLLGFLGMIEQARFEADRAEQEAPGLGQKVLEARMHAVSAEIDARGGHLDRAEKKFRVADALFEEAGNLWESAEVKLEILDALFPHAGADLAAHREAEVEELLEKAGIVALGAEGTLLTARYHLCRARLHAFRKRRGDARAELQRALEVSGQIKDEFDDFSWQIHLALARLSETEGDTDSAYRHIEKAAAVIESLEEKLPDRFRESFRGSPGRRRVFDMLQALRGRRKEAGFDAGPLRRMMTKLMSINAKIAAERDLSAQIGLILDSAIDVTGAERGFLLMPDESGDPNVCVARDFDTLSVPALHLDFSRSIARQVLEGGEPVYTISAMSDSRFLGARSVHELGLQSIICLPIRSSRSVVGALYLEHRSSRALLIPPEEKSLLLSFADQTAIAMENARLLSENIRRLDEVERLSREKERLLEKRTRALREAQRFIRDARDLFSPDIAFRSMVGKSSKMKTLFATIERLDESDVPVVITGESGTGKELVARAIHSGSGRRKKDFIAINCGALPPHLLESELFGYVKGAFTGAASGRRGIFSTASGGTLLLDEIAQMPLKMQVDLLRVLQESKVRPLGSNRLEPVDARVLAASQTPLETLVKRGLFREDLYYRLNVVSLALPPLRDRRDDIPLLTDHFLSIFSVRMKAPRKVVSRRAMKFLMDYPWPGNVRELENALLSAWVLEEGKLLDLENFHLLIEKERVPPEREHERPGAGAAGRPGDMEPLPAGPGLHEERERILDALKACGWNKSQAAQMLGIPRRTFYRKLKKYALME